MKYITWIAAATFLAGSVASAPAMQRSSGMNPNYKYGSAQTSAPPAAGSDTAVVPHRKARKAHH